MSEASVDFIKVELKMAVTLLQLSVTEAGLGDREGAQKAEALARDAFATFNRFWPAEEQRVSEKDLGEIKKLQQAVLELMPPLSEKA